MKLAHWSMLLLLAVRAIPAADRTLTDLLPPDSKVVMGINVRRAAAAPLVGAIAAQIRNQAQAQARQVPALPSAANWLNLALPANFDPMRDLDEVLVATNGEDNNPPVLAVGRGRFDVARMAHGAKPYHGVPVLGGEKPADAVVAFLDATTALAGNRNSVLAAIDHLQSGPRINAALAARIAAMRDQYDLWGFGDRPAGFVPPSPQAAAAESIDRFQFGVTVSRGVEFRAELHSRSPKDAAQLGAMLALAQATIKAQQGAVGGPTLEVQAANGTFKLSMTVPEAAVLKAIQTGLATPALGAAARPAAQPTTQKLVYDKDGNTVSLTLPGGKK